MQKDDGPRSGREADRVSVDLVVNCFERTYRQVLKPGYFPNIESMLCRRFTRTVALINNVTDREAAKRSAEALVECGDITEYYFVSELLDEALELVGLTREDFGRIIHFSDCALVAITLPGSDWLLYWDADVVLQKPCDWVAPALDLLASDPRILVANPSWEGQLRSEILSESGDFDLGYGFSDQVFLVRRRDLARPIYNERCAASMRYPLSHIALVFEARVDAYMRVHRRLRATYRGAVYVHDHVSSTSLSSHHTRGFREQWRRLLRRWVVWRAKHRRSDDPCASIRPLSEEAGTRE